MCLTIDASKGGMVAVVEATLGHAADMDASDPCTDLFKDRPRIGKVAGSTVGYLAEKGGGCMPPPT